MRSLCQSINTTVVAWHVAPFFADRQRTEMCVHTGTGMDTGTPPVIVPYRTVCWRGRGTHRVLYGIRLLMYRMLFLHAYATFRATRRIIRSVF